MKRTTAGMMRDYTEGIAEIDTRIEALKSKLGKIKVHTTEYNELAQRINGLEIMRGDMAWALHILKRYAI